MNFFETFILHMPQSVCLVPACGKDVERYFTTDGISQAVVCKLFSQDLDKGLPDTMLLTNDGKT